MTPEAPSRPTSVLIFGGTVYEIWGRTSRSIFADGAVLPAAEQDNDAYRATAERLGYADPSRMCVEHKALHHWLCHMLGLPDSAALRSAARGEPGDRVSGLEEVAVMALQEFAMAAGVDLLAVMRRSRGD